MLGLGNPGTRYQNTRHNVGFEVIDRLSHEWNIPVNQKGPNFYFGSGDFKEIPILLVKPQTYMNRSGATFMRLMREAEISPEETLVIHDDFNIDLGTLRLRRKGSHGGHNGLRSILEAAGTQDIPRLRIGIGDAQRGDRIDYVLSPFRQAERKVLYETVERAVDAIEILLLEGFEKSMNQFNR